MAILNNAAVSALAPALLRRAKWSFLGYGVAAYVGLRVARKFGLFGQYPDQAINFIDGQVKGRLGFDSKSKGAQQTAQASGHLN